MKKFKKKYKELMPTFLKASKKKKKLDDQNMADVSVKTMRSDARSIIQRQGKPGYGGIGVTRDNF
jgi:hypothetical protein